MVGYVPNCTLKDYTTHTKGETHSSIMGHVVDANNFELKPFLISMVQRNQFFGSPTDYSNLHISIFIKFCDTLKINFASNYAHRHIRKKIWVPMFSLRDIVRAWL